jgi:cytochrome P450
MMLFYYGLHRDEKYWDNPEAFRPGRFLKVAFTHEKPKAFYPFGAGPRLCIGNSFAIAEMTIALQALTQSFDFLPGSVAPGLRPLVTLRPDRVMLRIKKRKP